jgi:hypothetical protein
MAKRHKFVQRVLVSLFFSRVAASSPIRVRNVDGSTLATMNFNHAPAINWRNKSGDRHRVERRIAA